MKISSLLSLPVAIFAALSFNIVWAQAQQPATPVLGESEDSRGAAQDTACEVILDLAGGDSSAYHLYKDCVVYQWTFHRLAQERGLVVRSVDVACPNENGHAINAVLVGDKWMIIDTTTGIYREIAIVDDLNQIPEDVVCKAMFKAPGCGCSVRKISDLPQSSGNMPWACAEKEEASIGSVGELLDPNIPHYRSCAGCCMRSTGYYWSVGDIRSAPYNERWQQDCLSSCWNRFEPHSLDKWLNRHALSPTPWAKPNLDSGGNYFEAVCRSSTTMWRFVTSRREQCIECCVDGALQKKYNPLNGSSCIAQCNQWFSE